MVNSVKDDEDSSFRINIRRCFKSYKNYFVQDIQAIINVNYHILQKEVRTLLLFVLDLLCSKNSSPTVCGSKALKMNKC